MADYALASHADARFVLPYVIVEITALSPKFVCSWDGRLLANCTYCSLSILPKVTLSRSCTSRLGVPFHCLNATPAAVEPCLNRLTPTLSWHGPLVLLPTVEPVSTSDKGDGQDLGDSCPSRTKNRIAAVPRLCTASAPFILLIFA
jgi:hypothetical protein